MSAIVSRKKAGFSLIEVNMAILIAAGGLLALFSLFPTGMRQSVMAQADMYQSTFANSFFETVSANIREIDDLETWNDFEGFCEKAMEGTGVGTAADIKNATNAKAAVSAATKELFKEEGDTAKNFRFVCRELDRDNSGSDGGDPRALKLPAQFVVRIHRIVKSGFPNRYVVSLVSTDQFKPSIYHHNSVYSSEFYFNKRP